MANELVFAVRNIRRRIGKRPVKNCDHPGVNISIFSMKKMVEFGKHAQRRVSAKSCGGGAKSR